MTTPQDPPVRNKQKKRRTKQLAEWRNKKEASGATTPAKTPAKAPAKETKAPAKETKAPAKK